MIPVNVFPDTLYKTTRAVRDMLDQILIDQVSQDLERMRDIEREQGELFGDMRAIASEYIPADELEQRPGESELQYLERIRREA